MRFEREFRLVADKTRTKDYKISKLGDILRASSSIWYQNFILVIKAFQLNVSQKEIPDSPAKT
jgi:hypothetical protein